MSDVALRELIAVAKEWIGIEREKLALMRKTGGGTATHSTIQAGTVHGDEIPVAGEEDTYDPKVFGDMPRNWNGPNYSGKKFSETSPEFLRVHARKLWGLAKWQDENKKVDKFGKPSSGWSRKDAARALRWALRLEQSAPANQGWSTDLSAEELPF